MNKKIVLILIILAVGVVLAMSVGQCRTGVSPGRENLAAPDFSLKDLNGKTFRLSAQKGNIVLLFFGTTWCPACRQEIPALREIYEKYSPKGLRFFYIDINETAERVARFARQNSFPYPVLLDLDGSVSLDFNIIGVPTLILLDKEGKIISAVHRSVDLPLDSLFPGKK